MFPHGIHLLLLDQSPKVLKVLFLLMQIASQDRAQEAILAEHEEDAIISALRSNNEAQVLLLLTSSILRCI